MDYTVNYIGGNFIKSEITNNDIIDNYKFEQLTFWQINDIFKLKTILLTVCMITFVIENVLAMKILNFRSRINTKNLNNLKWYM